MITYIEKELREETEQAVNKQDIAILMSLRSCRNELDRCIFEFAVGEKASAYHHINELARSISAARSFMAEAQ